MCALARDDVIALHAGPANVRRLRLAAPPPKFAVSVIIPAHNEESSVGVVVRSALAVLGADAEVVVVDDGSTDGTADAARRAGARVVSRPYNYGNGSAVKAGIRAALGERLVFMDADGQHDPAEIPRLLGSLDDYDMVVGARSSDSQGSLGRRIANEYVFNPLASRLSGRRIDDLTSGFRAMSRTLAEQFLGLLPNTFGYPATITLASLKAGYTLGFVPMRFGRSRSPSHIRPARDGLRFISIILKIITLFSPMSVFGPAALALLSAGAAATLAAFTGRAMGTTAAVLIVGAVLLFSVGLVSEQIAAVRQDRSALDA